MSKVIKCPRCTDFWNSYRMRKIKHPTGAVLDICDRCNGMWIDGPEVKILRFKGKGGKKWQKKRHG